ncbi:MAG TPA: DegT/DnrJ/EryC1/StrS family aminotransferase, partial [Thermoleophilaceae bacterium]
WNERRRGAADAYAASDLGQELRLPVPGAGVDHVYHLYVATADDADELAARLGDAGVQARGYYRVPLHRQPPLAPYATGELPVTDELARTNIALPMGPELTQEQVAAVADACARTVTG